MHYYNEATWAEITPETANDTSQSIDFFDFFLSSRKTWGGVGGVQQPSTDVTHFSPIDFPCTQCRSPMYIVCFWMLFAQASVNHCAPTVSRLQHVFFRQQLRSLNVSLLQVDPLNASFLQADPLNASFLQADPLNASITQSKHFIPTGSVTL